MLDALAQSAAARLLIACDARQTPDRGTLSLIADLSAHAAQTRVWLILPHAGAHAPAGAGTETRAELWRDRLLALGLPADAILLAPVAPLTWLETGHG